MSSGPPAAPEPAALLGPAAGPGGPLDDAGPRPDRPSRGAVTLLVSFFLGLAVLMALSMVSLPYVVLQPGPAVNVFGKLEDKPILVVSGARTYPPDTTMDFTTVQVVGGPGRKVDVFDLAEAWIRPDYDVLDREVIYPEDVTEKQMEEYSAAEMVDSQEVASAVALRALGKKVTPVVVIAQVPEKSPATGKLKAGDRLVSIGGKPATSTEVVRKVVQSVTPGDTLDLVVRRGGAQVSVTTTTAERDGATVIGVLLGRSYDLPVDVKVQAGNVGGPSAGTMFALGIYDLLTPGDLAGDQDIAGTGTLDDNGTVGPIGGIPQKLAGARKAGAEWFLVPADNCAEARPRAPDGIRLVKVTTFDDALSSVRAIGEGRTGSLPTC